MIVDEMISQAYRLTVDRLALLYQLERTTGIVSDTSSLIERLVVLGQLLD